MAGNPSGKKDFTSGGTKPLVTYGFPQNSIIMLLRDAGNPSGKKGFTSGGTKLLVTYGFPQNSIIMLLRDAGNPSGKNVAISRYAD
jgi:hypothetical protein